MAQPRTGSAGDACTCANDYASRRSVCRGLNGWLWWRVLRNNGSLPRLIIDRSALQMLGADLVDELTIWLTPVVIPTLLRELIGNLSKEYTPRKGKLPPQDVLRALAVKLQTTGLRSPRALRNSRSMTF